MGLCSLHFYLNSCIMHEEYGEEACHVCWQRYRAAPLLGWKERSSR